MKKLFFAIILLFFCLVSYAQSSADMRYTVSLKSKGNIVVAINFEAADRLVKSFETIPYCSITGITERKKDIVKIYFQVSHWGNKINVLDALDMLLQHHIENENNNIY